LATWNKVKKLLLIIFLVYYSFAVSAQTSVPSTDPLISSCHFSNATFPEFCDFIFRETGVKVYYQDSWIDSLTVSLDADQISVKDAVETSLKNTGLQVSEWNGGLVILPGEKLLSRLPDFKTGKEQENITGKEGESLTQSEARYLTGRKADVTQTIRIGKNGKTGTKGTVTIRGRITEQQTGEPVIGATMYIEELKSGTSTDQDGFLSMVIKPGTYTAVFAYVGLERKKYQLEVLSEGDFNIEMQNTVIQMKEVVVVGDRQMNIRFTDPGLEKISAKNIKEIPTMMGERDILKISEMLPGIVTVGEGSSGLNVRGGNYDQNAFFINKIPIYNTSHLFGFFPAFNADIIKDFSIYKGHIPAQYGGRLSSVFNIIARQGNRKRFSLRGGVSPFAATLLVEGPVKKDVSSFMVSGRYLYSDWILQQIDDPVIRTSKAGFSDFSASWNYDFKKSQLFVFGYYSHDEFQLSDLSRYKYDNAGASVSFSHNFSTAVRGEFVLAGAQYAFSTIDEQEEVSAFRQEYKIGDYRFSADFTHELTAKNTLEYGAGLTFYKLDRGTVEPYGINSLRLPVSLGQEQGIESAIYISDAYEILPWLNLNAGFRLTLFNPMGPQTVYTYQEGLPMDPRFVEDSLNFASGEAIKWYLEPDFRIALNIRTDADGTVKLAFNQMHQNLFMMNNTIAISPNAQWILADYHLSPAKSNQFSAGMFRNFPLSGWETSLEAYYKTTIDYPEFIDGADFLNNPHVETTVLPGNQKAYGIEFLLRRNNRKLEGWLAYTWSRSIVQVNGDQPWDQINEGEAYPANYDIPHVINTVVNYHFNRRVTASGILTYQTGRPVTYPVSVYYINGIPFLDYSDRNEYRIPDYFRVDLSLTIEGSLRKKKLLHHSLIFSVYNLTGRDNPYSVYYKVENGKIKSYQYSVIGVPIFTATWLFKLGNYASD
jgi:hypothetical protein